MTITFVVNDLENRTQRIDPAFFHPAFYETMGVLNNIAKRKVMNVEVLDFFMDKTSPTHLTGGATPRGAFYIDDGIKFIRVQNVREEEIDLEKTVNIPMTVHEKDLKRSQLKPRDVLLTITGVTYGLAAVVPNHIGQANINQHVVKMEVNQNKIEPQYLSYYLNSTICKRQMDRAITGSSRPALDYRAIRGLRIAYPIDLEVQRIICEEINMLRDQARRKLIEARALADFENKLIIDKLGIEMPLKQETNIFEILPNLLLERIDAIAHDPMYQKILNALNKGCYKPKRLDKFGKLRHKSILPSENEPLGTFKIVELDDIDGDLGVITGYKEMHGIQINNQKIVFREGQILISRLRYYLRKIAIVEENILSGIGTSEMYTFDCNSDVDPLFLKSILRSDLVLLQAISKATGSSRPRINRGDIELFMIPDVPYYVQKNIAKEIQDIINKIQALREEAEFLITQARSKLNDFLTNQNESTQ